jgi:glutamate-1-semialdehyde 2,1-aminomutase
MSNGFPFGAVIGRDAIMQAADASFISSSYWTDGVAPAAALAVLEKVARLHVYEVVRDRGLRVQAAFRALAARHPACQLAVGGMPSTPTLTFGLGADAPLAQTLFSRQMRQRGILVASYYYLMLAHDDGKLDQMLNSADEALGEVAAAITAGRLAEATGGDAGQQGFARLA